MCQNTVALPPLRKHIMDSNQRSLALKSALQSKQRLLKLQKYFDTICRQATHLIKQELPTSLCACEGEWYQTRSALRLATQKALENVALAVKNLDKFKDHLHGLHDLNQLLSLDLLKADAALHANFIKYGGIFRAAKIENESFNLIELKWTQADLLNSVGIMHVQLEKFLEKLNAARTPRKLSHVLRGQFGDSEDDLGFASGDPGDPDSHQRAGWRDSWYVLEIIPVVIAALGGLANFLNDLASDSPGDIACEIALKMNCSEVNASSNQAIIDLINPMLDGATGDRDENAILHLMSCLPTDRVRSVVDAVSLKRLLSDFDGAEWDRLMLFLRHHGLVGFQNWDDDASRLFINTNTPSTLNSLSLNDIATLIHNMFQGSCGDDDEQAIIRLLTCIDCQRVRQLVSWRGFSVDDFDDNVDGAEWTRLKQVFQHCGIPV